MAEHIASPQCPSCFSSSIAEGYGGLTLELASPKHAVHGCMYACMCSSRKVPLSRSQPGQTLHVSLLSQENTSLKQRKKKLARDFVRQQRRAMHHACSAPFPPSANTRAQQPFLSAVKTHRHDCPCPSLADKAPIEKQGPLVSRAAIIDECRCAVSLDYSRRRSIQGGGQGTGVSEF